MHRVELYYNYHLLWLVMQSRASIMLAILDTGLHISDFSHIFKNYVLPFYEINVS
jgi:hypothetical protein